MFLISRISDVLGTKQTFLHWKLIQIFGRVLSLSSKPSMTLSFEIPATAPKRRGFTFMATHQIYSRTPNAPRPAACENI